VPETKEIEMLADAVYGCARALSVLEANFRTPCELDKNGCDANVVDGLFAIARSIQSLGNAVHTLIKKRN
jgi:hypothetical protein